MASKCVDEAQAELMGGVWLAAWFGRVDRFNPVPSKVPGTPTDLPFLPVLVVLGEKWQLCFAFNGDAEINVCGPVDIGSTSNLRRSYRLLAVLRLLAGWVAGEFRGWVERCIA